jgi:hypothetical protein
MVDELGDGFETKLCLNHSRAMSDLYEFSEKPESLSAFGQ